MSSLHPKVYHSNDLSRGHAVYVGRGTDWGNPFILREEHQRDHVCDLFERYAIWRTVVEPDWLKPLRGKNLCCWCAPKRCHADTLLRLANV